MAKPANKSALKASETSAIQPAKDASRARSLRLSKGQKGISLIEVIIVLLVMAIMVVIAVPRGVRQLQLYRLDTSVSIVSEKLAEARMTAIKRNRGTWLRIDKTARTAQIRSTNPANGATIDLGYPERFPNGVVLDAADSVDITFDSMGQSVAGTQSFILQEATSTKRKAITVSPTGKITVGAFY
jgi:prepilin-type N-terminal cleavage/methylation domain-containing protein